MEKDIIKMEILNLKLKMAIKEYYINDEDSLKLEGDYLNGEITGKVKEYYYYKSKIRFEGEYLDGKRNGKGKEYYYTGELLCEGEYLNGERNGEGKEYTISFMSSTGD